ncbi:TPA: hypothetical protein HA235_02985 [Candidatus Woesearchaeota archaeon]|nr:hypothetical protein [Candidatus Woesearchaeota archaeon]HIH31648.1 hypothetical protein [Candidatus Woesearchaeota archaeon]HIH55423.1 hypothetical protein [Candidatus Woesearchaeota archaeon]HIJ02049.1 hypothetical protein [Candidatus Woesearchaeota archaeon]HIJ14614.1 hypothetical protein [Candidatus Woesearchaeota archaeon]
MNIALKRMIAVMMNQHIVGHKHIPEMLLIKSRIKNLSKQQQKEFMDEYSRLVNMDYFWRLKKRTGKGTEWHISINPDMLVDLKELIGDEST